MCETCRKLMADMTLLARLGAKVRLKWECRTCGTQEFVKNFPAPVPAPARGWEAFWDVAPSLLLVAGALVIALLYFLTVPPTR